MTAQTAEVTEKTEDKKPDLEVILPPEGELTIDGIDCYVKRLKTREFFQLMGIVTVGLGGNLSALNFDAENQEEYAAGLLGALLVALPQAVDPFLRLVRDIVKPQDDRKADELRDALENPELDDLLGIADVVVFQEQGTLWELVGKVKAYAARWKTTTSLGTARGRKRST